MDKIKVLWFSNTPAAGDEFISSNGTGGWLKSLDKALQDKIDLHVAFNDRHYPEEFTVGKTTYHQIAPYGKLKLIKRKVFQRYNRNTDLPKYLDLINKVKPDLIHIHGTEQSFVQLTKYTDIPVLLSIQAILTVMNHKYYSGISKNDLPLYANSFIKSYNRFTKQAQIERENLPYVKYVMGRTDWDRRVYSVLAPQAKYYVSNEVLRDSFYTRTWVEPKRNDNKIILHTTTGGLLFKGFETLCLALQQLIRVGLNVEWRVAGLSENHKLVKVVKKKLGKDYPQKGLVLFGSLSEADLIERMLESSVFVYPTHQDNSSNALCEAMILGIPCVSTFAGGSGTMLKDGEEGIMVQDGDPWAMAGAVIELITNREKALIYGQNARKKALVRHSKDSIVDSVMEVYEEIVSEENGGK